MSESKDVIPRSFHQETRITQDRPQSPLHHVAWLATQPEFLRSSSQFTHTWAEMTSWCMYIKAAETIQHKFFKEHGRCMTETELYPLLRNLAEMKGHRKEMIHAMMEFMK
jgi:hypothetical protein